MDNVQEDMEKKNLFPTTYDQHTKQHRVETSGSSLIVILKMMVERKEGLDKSKTCCRYGQWMVYGLSLHIRLETICIKRELLFATVL